VQQDHVQGVDAAGQHTTQIHKKTPVGMLRRPPVSPRWWKQG